MRQVYGKEQRHVRHHRLGTGIEMQEAIFQEFKQIGIGFGLTQTTVQ